MKRFFRALTAVLTLAGAVVLPYGQAFAQSNALTITPRRDYTLQAGESVSDSLTISNPNPTEPLILKLKIVDFSAQDETGTPLLDVSGKDSAQTAWSIKKFVSVPSQVTLDKGKSTSIPINVSVPSGTGAGSYYSAVTYSATTQGGQNVTINASGVTLMFVKVPGQTKEQLDFLQFGAFVPNRGGTGGSFAGLFFNSQPKVLAYRLKNQGNIAEQPKGNIVVRDFSGKTVAQVNAANPKSQLALRGQTRLFDACIKSETQKNEGSGGADIDTVVCVDPGLKPGRYSAELHIFYGENGNETREITAKSYFWYLPWWFIGLVVVALLIIAGIVFFVLRRVRDVRSRKTRRR
jgi:hypothetical protein